MHGAFNVAATEQITNAGFSRALAKSFNKPLLLPNIPAAVLKLALGEMAETLLKGGCVSSDKLRKEGVAFKFNKCAEALADLAGAKASR
jgi:NAD dependent epimerase/dehydratase family enzyme